MLGPPDPPPPPSLPCRPPLMTLLRVRIASWKLRTRATTGHQRENKKILNSEGRAKGESGEEGSRDSSSSSPLKTIGSEEEDDGEIPSPASLPPEPAALRFQNKMKVTRAPPRYPARARRTFRLRLARSRTPVMWISELMRAPAEFCDPCDPCEP